MAIQGTDYLVVNRGGVDYKSEVKELNIPQKTSELDNDSNFITLAEVPEPDLEGSLIFRGNVANEAALPGDAAQGDLYYNEDDNHLYAKGASQWHKLNTVDDVDLDGYATEAWVEGKSYITAADLPDAFSGDYNDLTNTPTIPSKTSELDNDSGFITLSDVPPAPDGGIPEAPTDGQQYARKSSAWAVVEIPEGFSGDYNDLTNKPSIPTDNAELANGANYITLAEVPAGFSGDYNDLTNQPTIPTDNADLANGAGYITLSEVPEPDLEGTLTFRGNVANEAALPGDAGVGDLYYNEEDGHLYAKGESQWHKLNTIDDVDLDAYARLDGANFTGDVTVDGTSSLKDIRVVEDVNGGRPAEFATVWKNAVNIECIQGNSQNGFHFRGYNADKSARIEIESGDDGITLKDTSIDDNFKVIITPQGSVTATEFIGDGSKLTGVGLPDFRTLTPLS